MRKKLLILITLFNFINTNSQITCDPSNGDTFEPVTIGTNFREKPNKESIILYKINNLKNEFFECVDNTVINGYFNVKIGFTPQYLENNGLKRDFILLYEYFIYDLNYNLTLREFVESVKNENTVKNYYDLTSNIEEVNNTLTYEEFKKTYLNLKITPLGEKLIDTYNLNGYIHKSQLKKYFSNTIYFYLENSSENNLEELNRYLERKTINLCNYDEQKSFSIFSHYILALIDEGNPFLAIQEINNYSNNFQTTKHKNAILLLKMYCSHKDDNDNTTITIGKSLISSYKQNTLSISNSGLYQSIINGDIDISKVYQLIITSLMKNNSNTLALNYSKECITNKKLQYDGYLLNHGIILYSLNRKIEACKYINEEYLNGNENAKRFLEDFCE